ncbi:endonuclease/exonuclease/phosphatase family protein [Bifidobacterium pluvialisilvae]|uniref:endonuclease/exonuclease/phosphatase family protein n=1 Tax=Bifidobacterium pluvialisilvae TaxID=2834436 RepID=UPI0027E22C7A|nr:endonuclease/exonuclease/phosphatase family protein [Bifidobacterium pluvialisilvae]
MASAACSVADGSIFFSQFRPFRYRLPFQRRGAVCFPSHLMPAKNRPSRIPSIPPFPVPRSRTVILWIPLVVVALWMALKYLPAGWDHHRPLPEAIALVPLLVAPIILLLVVALVVRAWPQAVMAVVLLVIQLLWQLPYVVPLPGFTTAMLGVPLQSVAGTTLRDSGSMESAGQSPTTIRVMTVNTRYGRADTGTIMHLVKQEHVDVLAVQEVHGDLIHRLEQSHIDDELPYRVLGKARADDNAGSNALLMRFRPVEYADSSVDIRAAAAPVAKVRIGGQLVEFASVHPKSPPRSGQDWSDGVRALGEFANRADACNTATTLREMSGTSGLRHDIDSSDNPKLPTDADGTPKQYSTAPHCAAVVMGDMNSSVFHPSFRDALRHGSGLADSSLELHHGWHPTFPASWPTFPALIEIDHVLHSSGIVAKSVRTARVPRTDHLALIVKLEVQ